jgi:quaternary ammonium compound-resistance protein SugE
LVTGGLADVAWAVALKSSDGFREPLPSFLSLLFIAVSYGLYALSVRQLPIGSAYSVFIGIGAAGTVVCGMLFLGEPADWPRLLFVLLLLLGVVGLKLEDGKS